MAARRTDKKRQPQTFDPLRRIRDEFQPDHVAKQDRRCAEDRFRDERHDAHAVTIRAERRQGRSETELRTRRQQLELEWKAEQEASASVKRKPKTKS